MTDVLGKVTSGEADAGLVYVTDVQGAGDSVEGVEFPESVECRQRVPDRHHCRQRRGGSRPSVRRPRPRRDGPGDSAGRWLRSGAVGRDIARTQGRRPGLDLCSRPRGCSVRDAPADRRSRPHTVDEVLRAHQVAGLDGGARPEPANLCSRHLVVRPARRTHGPDPGQDPVSRPGRGAFPGPAPARAAARGGRHRPALHIRSAGPARPHVRGARDPGRLLHGSRRDGTDVRCAALSGGQHRRRAANSGTALRGGRGHSRRETEHRVPTRHPPARTTRPHLRNRPGVRACPRRVRCDHHLCRESPGRHPDAAARDLPAQGNRCSGGCRAVPRARHRRDPGHRVRSPGRGIL